ncbi:MgtC/SapB family protein [Chitinimonas sp. BJYL2]|uniref:MgtC/SapB family protein n=1 Tax=Chitinimonas sp. BJYL2 TaxID=2976696 RepID=UPI0022B5721E|nr:MgtC/SapB family protein [Chitinimonas sp. BJYL2]
MLDLNLLPGFALSLALGFLLGLERERNPAALAGVRTFALTALLGTLSAMLSERWGSPWLIVVAWLAVAMAIVQAYRDRAAQTSDPGTTTEVALLFCFGLGVLCWLGEHGLAIALGVTATALLHFKTELAGLAHRFAPDDIRSVLQFAVLSLVILPMLPDRQFGPYGAFNPYRTGLLAVLISGISLGGFIAQRAFGARAGARLAGVLGGLVSSTATTLAQARLARATDATTQAALVTVLANLTVLPRLALTGSLVAPVQAPALLIIMGGALLAGLLAAWPLLRAQPAAMAASPAGNPAAIGHAVMFAALYSAVLLAAAWLNDVVGHGGLYLLALLSGMTDVDAITLSSLQMAKQQQLAGSTALLLVVLALASNTVFKLGMAFMLGGAAFGWRIFKPLAWSLTVAAALVMAMALY